MLKRITFLVIVLVFARPAYEMISPLFKEQPAVVVEEAVLPVNTASIVVEEDHRLIQDVEPGLVTSADELADAFAYYFNQWSTNFTIHYKGNTADLERMLDVAVNQALAKDTYRAGHLATREIQYEYTKSTATIRVTQSYLTTPQQEQVVDTVIKQVIAELNVAAMSDYDKVKFVNDYIVKNTVYSEQTSASAHSAYAVAYEGKGVCQGYALFAQKLLTTLGIESLYVVGEVYTGGHAWNLVEVDGEWYHLDTTWNDPIKDRGTGVGYKYFLINDTDLRKDHTWESADYPKATSKKYSYMHQMQDSYELGDYIYYSNVVDNNTLYRYSLVNNQSERLADTRALYIVGNDEWLYFSNYSNGAYLSRVRLDGSDLEVIYKAEVRNLMIDQQYIYFATETDHKKIALQ